jgi:flagellin-like hook-associated protein FlgL
MMRYNFLRSLNNSMETQNSLQEQLSDGKSLHRPSDDPVRTVRDLSFKTSLTQNTQFTQNLQDAQSWMENTDGVMSDLSSVMIKIKELVVSADDTKPTESLNTIGTQIDGLINQIVSLGNTKIGDRYLFGGQNDSTQPFVRTTIKDPNSDLMKEVVIYYGDDNRISMPIQTGAVNPSQDSVNLTGTDVFGPTSTIYGQKTLDVLNHLLEIKNELTQKSSVTQTNANGGIGSVGGKYTGAGYANFDVRVDNVDQSGRVLGASYSNDGGNTWIAVGTVGASGTVDSTIDNTNNPAVITLPNGVKFNIADSAKITQTNSLGGAAKIVKGATATDYTVELQAVNGNGQFTQYSLDGGTTWLNTDISDTVKSSIILPNGAVLNIAADTVNNHDGDQYTVEVTDNMEITQTNPTGGKASVSDSKGYSVKIDSVDPSTKQVTAATYSVDGGVTWHAFAATDSSNPLKTILTLPDGSELEINTDADNTVGNQYTVKPQTNSGNVYSFRVPQEAFNVAKSNSSGGDASITGASTFTDSIPNSIRIDSVDSGTGKVTAASYSTDGGNTWTSLSNYQVTQTNSTGSPATVTGNLVAGAPYSITITGVDQNGKITEVNGGAFPVSYDTIYSSDSNSSSTIANIQLPNGAVLHIPSNVANKTGDTYTVTATGNFIDTTGSSTVINLPDGSTTSGFTLTIEAKTANKANDTYSFDLPQGKGPDVNWLSKIATQYVSDDHNRQLKAQTNLGARMSMYEMALNMMQSQNTTIQTDIAHTEDIDMPKAITDFNTAQNIYRSALAVGGRIMPTSLVDFLQ